MTDQQEQQAPPKRKMPETLRLALLSPLWLLSALYLWQSLTLPDAARPTPVQPGLFPSIVATVLFVSMTVIVTGSVIGIVKARHKAAENGLSQEVADSDERDIDGADQSDEVASVKDLLFGISATVVYVLLFFPLGYLIATLTFLSVTILFYWRSGRYWAFVLAAALTLAIGWIFEVGLRIELPHGLLPLPF